MMGMAMVFPFFFFFLYPCESRDGFAYKRDFINFAGSLASHLVFLFQKEDLAPFACKKRLEFKEKMSQRWPKKKGGLKTIPFIMSNDLSCAFSMVLFSTR